MAKTAEKRLRPWSAQAEERLEDLLEALEHGVRAGLGDRVARELVPSWAGYSSMTAMAEAMGEDRGNLSACLGAVSTNWPLRRRMEEHLELPPGGMEAALALVEQERGE